MSARFAELHRSGCFVMPNPWDAGSLRLLVRLGFPAVATTSSGWAWSRGRPDNALTRGGRAGASARDGRRVAGAGERRLRGRLRGPTGGRRRQRGQRRERRVWRGCRSKTPPGTPAQPLFDFDARGRTRARRTPGAGPGQVASAAHRPVRGLHRRPARAGGDAAPARGLRRGGCGLPVRPRDPHAGRDWRGRAGRVAEASQRPGRRRTSRRWRTSPPLGVRRISVGGALARAAWTGFLQAAREIAEHGTFARLGEAMPFADVNAMFPREMMGHQPSDKRVIAST